MKRYGVYVVERDAEDLPVSWEAVGPVVTSLDEALQHALRVANPHTEIAEMIEGFNVLTPKFA